MPLSFLTWKLIHSSILHSSLSLGRNLVTKLNATRSSPSPPSHRALTRVASFSHAIAEGKKLQSSSARNLLTYAQEQDMSNASQFANMLD